MLYQFFDSLHYPFATAPGQRILDDAHESKLGAHPKDRSLAGDPCSVLLLTLIRRKGGEGCP